MTVVIPVRDEAASIEALLDDLRAQVRAPEEILVVDAGSVDDTRQRVATCARRDSRVRLLSLDAAYPGAGRNAALREARGAWVAFVDGGIRVGPEWLLELMAPADRGEPVDAVLGGFEPARATRAERAAALAYVPARRPAPAGGTWRNFFLASSAVRLETALQVGGFPESLRSGEDLLFWRRLTGRGRIAYAPAAVVHWTQASGPRAIWRRFRTYAEHSCRAGLMDDWLAVTARRYALLLLTGPLLPLAAGGLLLARAAAMQRRKPEFADAGLGPRLRQLLDVAILLGVIDAATAAGWWAWRRAGAARVDTAGGLSGAAARARAPVPPPVSHA